MKPTCKSKGENDLRASPHSKTDAMRSVKHSGLCTECGENERLPYNHSWCRDCRNAYSRANRKRNSELSPEARQRGNARAYARVYQSRGMLLAQPCEVCGDTKVEKHHDDYSKPLEVRWLCKTHHRELHASK